MIQKYKSFSSNIILFSQGHWCNQNQYHHVEYPMLRFVSCPCRQGQGSWTGTPKQRHIYLKRREDLSTYHSNPNITDHNLVFLILKSEVSKATVRLFIFSLCSHRTARKYFVMFKKSIYDNTIDTLSCFKIKNGNTKLIRHRYFRCVCHKQETDNSVLLLH